MSCSFFQRYQSNKTTIVYVNDRDIHQGGVIYDDDDVGTQWDTTTYIKINVSLYMFRSIVW